MRLSSKGDSLHARLAKTLVLPLLVLYAASGGLAYWAVRHYADRVYDRWLYDSLTSLARQVRLSGDRAALDLPQAAKEIFEWDDEDLTMFRVVGSRSGLLAGQPDLPTGGTHAETFRNATLFDAPVRGHLMRWATLQLAPGEVGEAVTVLVGETMRKREHLQDEILIVVWVPQIALLLVVAFLTYRTIQSQTRRIESLSSTLRDFSARHVRPIDDADTPAELRPFTQALNALLARLEQAAVAQRSFIANAAHQLRTPLTALSLQAEQARHCSSTDEMKAAILGLQNAATRAARLANQLLLLARAEPEAQSAQNRTVTDLYDLAFETASAWAAKAIAKNIDLGFDDGSAHARADVDAALMGEAIHNLIDNALKYCGPGARVTVSVSDVPEPTVIVEDSGPGIPEHQRSRVVERFYRGDKTSHGGTGLGLAIVNEVALAHGGRLVIGETHGGGARFEIHVPAVSTARPARGAAPGPALTRA